MVRLGGLVLLVLTACVVQITLADIILAESGPIGAQILGSSNVTLIDVTPTRSLPSVCKKVSCFPKCCPFGQSLINKTCTPTNYSFDPVYYETNNESYPLFENGTEPFHIIIGEVCNSDSRYPLDIGNFYLLRNGSMELSMDYAEEGEKNFYEPNEYCLDSLRLSHGEVVTVPIICSDSDEMQQAFAPLYLMVYPVGLIISVCFLILTMFVYLSVQDLLDLQGMTLVCHLGCQTLAYIFLAVVQMSGPSGLGLDGCTTVAYIIQFLFAGSFVWLNVMCFNSTWCVMVATLPERNLEEGPKWWWNLHYPGAKKWEKVGEFYMAGRDDQNLLSDYERIQKEKRFKHYTFCVYSVYAWFFSLLPVILVLAKKLGPTIPNTYLQYNMISYNCNFTAISDEDTLPYFYIPVGITMGLNILMFTYTMIKCMTYPWNKKGPHRIPRQKARMCYMLFFCMGLNWLTDIIAWAVRGDVFTWNVLNVFNVLQGLVTFFIFVMEDWVKILVIRNLWPKVKNFCAKYHCCDVERPEESYTANETTTMLNHFDRSPPQRTD